MRADAGDRHVVVVEDDDPGGGRDTVNADAYTRVYAYTTTQTQRQTQTQTQTQRIRMRHRRETGERRRKEKKRKEKRKQRKDKTQYIIIDSNPQAITHTKYKKRKPSKRHTTILQQTVGKGRNGRES